MSDNPILTDAHFHAFGYITYQYARIERGFRFYIAHHIGVDVPTTSILTAPYGARDYRNVIKSLLRMPDGSREHLHELGDLLGRFQRLGRWRNHIAHSAWIEGHRPASIKPLGVDIRDDKPVFVGAQDDEPDYTLSEIKQWALDADALHTDCLEFYHRHQIGPFDPSLLEDE